MIEIAIRLAVVAGLLCLTMFVCCFPFKIKLFFRKMICWKGHDWFTVEGWTEQCRRCYKVAEISKERAWRE